jgi:hypothetical protein
MENYRSFVRLTEDGISKTISFTPALWPEIYRRCGNIFDRFSKGRFVMQRFIKGIFIVWTVMAIFTDVLWSEVFCVSSAAELQTALDNAAANGQSDLIKVVQGTYAGSFVYDSTQGDSLALLGGYNTGCTARVVNPLNTVLDGGGLGRVLYLNNSEGGDIFVEGFTIQDGNAAGSGGGIYASSSADSGLPGYIYIVNNILIGNTASGNGGGVLVVSFSMSTNPSGIVFFENNAISLNTANTGGGVFAHTYSNGGIAGDITFTNNTVYGNESRDGFLAGGIYASSEGLNESGKITVSDNIIKGNTADWYGGLALFSQAESSWSGNLVLTNNFIIENTAERGGGAFLHTLSLFGIDGIDILTNNTVTGNGALDHGGGLKILIENYVEMHNNIVWGNTAPTGADIYFEGGGVAFGFRNDYSDLQGSWLSYGGNIDADPLFVNASGGDYHLRSISPCVDAGYNSPPSLPPFDREGDPRIVYGKYDGDVLADMGADEFVRNPVFNGHDFNGNGSSDISVWRPSNGRWYLKDVGSYGWGQLGDVPVNGDYDGDGLTDIAVWRPTNGRWYVKDAAAGTWGTSGDIPVPGNYDGDGSGRTDIAVWRPSNGRWYIKDLGSHIWGDKEDIPVPGDYDGNGITDIAVWRPSNGRWYIKGIGGSVWGTSGDIPVPGDYNGDGITDIAVWRPLNGRWYIKGIGGSVWGTIGDLPLVR